MKIVTPELLADLLARAAASPRLRTNLNLHEALSDPINRFLNAGLAGTYVRPHRHRSGKWEVVSVLQGGLDLLIFATGGRLEARIALGLGGACVVEIPGGDWHTFVFHAPAAVVLEVKPGPYEPHLDKEFADWAPAEDSPTAASFVTWLESAAIGHTWPQKVEGADHSHSPGL
jgi:cupin fold WbuC family metalloprotein